MNDSNKLTAPVDTSKILIVDDSNVNLDVLRKILESENFSVFVAPSGTVTLKIAPEVQPDLILLDIMMPDIDGFETCQRLKENPLTADIPIIFLSAKSDTEDMVKGFSLGAVDFIQKPFQGEIVIARAKTHIKVKKLIEQIKSASNSDPLTGLLNRRGMNEKLEEEIARFQRNRQPFCLLLGDIDFFKRVNDDYGHAMGDHVLKEIARIMNLHSRKNDWISRWGGEEFLILLTETPLDGAMKRAETLRREVENAVIHFDDETIKVTMSLGVSVYNDETKNLDACIQTADEYLYQAKDNGRNQVMGPNQES
ncbi:MAG: diguanylate cyclase [Candidatus Nitrohelix vancouverensis]|uniref:diguanylate cyclase n=1 Tax=Candidatus Nitrohelix vancouverensis TaxID=2705534 RepID=A0A7T0G4J7_9BACT|nr:MAG: diguanylate cyclase [Candidatus Nitrohelix vancouverensis]